MIVVGPLIGIGDSEHLLQSGVIGYVQTDSFSLNSSDKGHENLKMLNLLPVP